MAMQPSHPSNQKSRKIGFFSAFARFCTALKSFSHLISAIARLLSLVVEKMTV
jgi:hypothetical protein